MARAFISYVREDSRAVDLLVEALKHNGVEVWVDRESSCLEQGGVMQFAPQFKGRFLHPDILVELDPSRTHCRQ